jgi:hypothetical protein
MLSDVANDLLWIALGFFLLGGLLAIYLSRTRGAIEAGKWGALFIVIGAVFLVSNLLIGSYLVGQPASVAPPPGGAVQVTVSGGSLGTAGVTWNQASSTLTVDVVWNYTSNYFGIEAANTSTCGTYSGAACHPNNYLLLPITMSRTDAINTTFGYTDTVSAVPLFATIGSTPTQYSVNGYKPASGSTPGTWQMFWSAGSYANQNPSVSAPGTSSNVLSSLVGIAPFHSTTNVLHISLAGSNSTSNPATGQTLFQTTTIQQFVAQVETLTISGGATPSSITVDWICIGQHA